jgi:hypothetical protein
MSIYTNYGVTLSENQIRKLQKARNSDCDVTLRISKPNLTGKMNLPLTNTQINKIKKTKSGVQLTLSKSQLSHLEKSGGFLPLLALIPGLIGALGGIGGLAGGIASAVNSSKQTAEMVRHNKEEEDLVKRQLSSGSGIISNAVAPIPLIGKPLSTTLKKFGLGGCVENLKGVKWGNGLYLERQGGGLFLGRVGEDH